MRNNPVDKFFAVIAGRNVRRIVHWEDPQRTRPDDARVGDKIRDGFAAEAVLDKGYHSKKTLLDLHEMDIRSYASEPDRGRQDAMAKSKFCARTPTTRIPGSMRFGPPRSPDDGLCSTQRPRIGMPS